MRAEEVLKKADPKTHAVLKELMDCEYIGLLILVSPDGLLTLTGTANTSNEHMRTLLLHAYKVLETIESESN